MLEDHARAKAEDNGQQSVMADPDSSRSGEGGSGDDGGSTELFHERQSLALCAVHAINNVLQEKVKRLFL